MVREDFHVHSNFSDGINNPEDIVKCALDRGIERLGISDHGYSVYDPDCGMHKDRIDEYGDEIRRLKEKYKGKIDLFLGIEQDYYGIYHEKRYEYVIGSVHNIKAGDDYYTVDYKYEILEEAKKKHFGNDMYKLIECYFETVSDVVMKTECDIIGHFDLIAKLSEKYDMFDKNDDRYVSLWKKAADTLITYKKPFEINTGAISRGYRTAPYPDIPIIKYISERGGKFILSSDSHDMNNLCFEFDKWENVLKNMGIEMSRFEI